MSLRVLFSRAWIATGPGEVVVLRTIPGRIAKRVLTEMLILEVANFSRHNLTQCPLKSVGTEGGECLNG